MKIEIKIVGQIDPKNYDKISTKVKDLLSLFETYKFNFEENKEA